MGRSHELPGQPAAEDRDRLGTRRGGIAPTVGGKQGAARPAHDDMGFGLSGGRVPRRGAGIHEEAGATNRRQLREPEPESIPEPEDGKHTGPGTGDRRRHRRRSRRLR